MLKGKNEIFTRYYNYVLHRSYDYMYLSNTFVDLLAYIIISLKLYMYRIKSANKEYYETRKFEIFLQHDRLSLLLQTTAVM